MKIRTIIPVTLLASAFVLAPHTLLAQMELQSRYFQTSDDIQLHYLEAGSGPPLVFIPGWTMPAWIWKPQLEHFAVNYRVLALDPRGQGQSEKPTEGYHATRRARDIVEFLDHLDDEPAVIVGWSLAVQEILVCTYEFGTEAIRAVVLVDHPVNMDANTDFSSNRISELQLNREEWTRNFIEIIHKSPQSEEYLDKLSQAVLSTPTNAAAIMTANIYFIGPRDLRPALGALDRPVLFVFSSLDWAVFAANEVREGWPEIPVKVIDDTSHALFVDKSEEFNQVLKEFLTYLP